jgi:hypothetical protein
MVIYFILIYIVPIYISNEDKKGKCRGISAGPGKKISLLYEIRDQTLFSASVFPKN